MTDGRQLSSNICWMTNVGRQMSVVCQQMSDDICWQTNVGRQHVKSHWVRTAQWTGFKLITSCGAPQSPRWIYFILGASKITNFCPQHTILLSFWPPTSMILHSRWAWQFLTTHSNYCFRTVSYIRIVVMRVGWLVGWLISVTSITVGLLCRMLSDCRCKPSSRLRSWLFL